MDKTNIRTVNKADFFMEPPLKIVLMLPNPDEPVVVKRKPRFIGELKIEDCKLNICGCRFAPTFLRRLGRRADFKSSIENIQCTATVLNSFS